MQHTGPRRGIRPLGGGRGSLRASLLLWVALLVPAACGATGDEVPAAVIDSLIAADLPPYGTGVAAIVMHHGRIVYERGFGFADIARRTPMTSQHVFRVGSITKQFTACAILKLAAGGTLSLDEDIRAYLPAYPTQGQRITIENLLTHTSGLKDYTNFAEWTPEFQKRDITPREMLEFIKRDSLSFLPGENFFYSNTNYFLLGCIIESVSGNPYEEYLRTSFFEPLGLTRTRYAIGRDQLPAQAIGYDLHSANAVVTPPISLSQAFAAGGLVSTVGDLAAWYRALCGGRILSERDLQRAHTPYRLNDGTSTGYGYGWILSERFGRPTIEHGGSINGFFAKDLYFPEDDLLIALFSNCISYNPNRTAIAIAAELFRDTHEQTSIVLTGEQRSRLLGQYYLNADMTIAINLRGDALYLRVPGEGNCPMTPLTPTECRIQEIDGGITFTELDGRVTGLMLIHSGMRMKAMKIE